MPTLLHPVFMHVEPLPEACFPAEVVRRHGMTLVWVDPGALRAHVAMWSQDHLNDRERLALRAAFRQSLDLHNPPDDDLVAGSVRSLVVPPMLRMPGEDDASAETA